MPPATSRAVATRRASTTLRVALFAAAAGMAVTAWWSWRQIGGERRELLALLAGADLEPVASILEEPLQREDETPRMRLLVARSLLATELDPELRQATLLRDPGEDLAARLRRLELARELAADAFAERPSAWRAPAVLGAATFLERSLTRDRRLLTEAADWQDPLLHARELAPAAPEPSTFLVLAYLETWPYLSPEKRQLARELLQQSFADRRSFGLLLDHWLRVAESREEALAAIPDEPFAWEHLRRLAAAQRDWASYSEAQRRWEEAMERSLHLRLQEAQARRSGGEIRQARDLYLGAAVGAPPSRRFLPVLRRALQEAPPGLPASGVSQRLQPWLEWALEQCLYVSCPLPPAELHRLVGLVREQPAHQEAAALVAAGDLPRGELVERRQGRPWTEEWGPYHLLRARHLADQGRHREARQALATLHRRWRDSPPHRRLEAALDQGLGEPANARASGDGPIPPERWEWESGGVRLGIDLGRRVEGFELPLARVSDEGSVVELLVDGAASEPAAVYPGDAVRWRRPIAAGPHLLELRTVAGARVAPGRLRWSEEPSSPPSRRPAPPPPPPRSPGS